MEGILIQVMQDIFNTYIQSISSKLSYPETSEMGYRADFEILLKGIYKSINIKRIDHDARARDGNRPDFVVLDKDVPNFIHRNEKYWCIT